MEQAILTNGSKEKPFSTEFDRDLNRYPKEYCLGVLKSDMYVWDMRYWNRYKDRKEVMQKIDEIMTGKMCLNSGHAQFCVKLLVKGHKATKKEITMAMLKNPHIQFKNRLAKCGYDPEKCPEYKKQGHYGNGICDKCD